METSQIYQYDPLPVSDDTVSFPFRILRLLPGTGESPLRGEICHARLDRDSEPPSYEALSYCWGDPRQVDHIAIGAAHLPLTRSLRTALSQVRLPDVERRLWIDAICINQNDVDERSREVSLMHRIYSEAREVLIWLDEPPVEPRYWSPERAFALAERLSAVSRAHPDLSIRNHGRLRGSMVRRRVRIGPRGNSDALRLVFTRPWFERMWVVQEAVCARAAVVVCGGHTIGFGTLMSAVEYGVRSGLFEMRHQRKLVKPVQIGAPPTHISAAMAMHALGGARRPPSSSSSSPEHNDEDDDLLSFLRRFHGSRCADPRDKLFALYGISSLDQMESLARDFAAMGIAPDYRAEPRALFLRTAKGILDRTGTLDLLSVPRLDGPENNRVAGLPSWAPSWGAIDADDAALCYTAPTPHSASGDSRSAPGFVRAGDQELLVLSGYVFDHVVEVASRSSPSGLTVINQPDPADSPVAVLALLIIWACDAVHWELDSPGAYVTGEDMVEVYWALVLAFREQFQTAWYADGLSNRPVRPGPIGRWCGRWLDRCPRFRHPRFPYAYYLVIYLTVCARGLTRFGQHDEAVIRYRSLVKTAGGYIGLAPVNVQPGDVVLLCQGGKRPLIARPACYGPNPERFSLVGDVYLHGIMKGEAWNEKFCRSVILE
ncbi:heterokaryon incompatibility protein-domain-containing protein [Xylaria palmicola]|nr:heterokaryon incompatibility protein-domain-containing protein [Xylaria palmicola]